MELPVEQQIFDQLGKANKVLVALPENMTADQVAAGLALALFLKKMDKDVELAGSGTLAGNLNFLPGVQTFKADISGGKSLVVSVDTSVKKLDEISYQSAGDKVSIYLKPKDGVFTQEDLSFSTDKFPVDVIVAVGAKSLESFGKLFERHADLFFETPKINIDNKAGNEYFGAINLVDINSSSVSEILGSLFEKYETLLVDEDIATCLLTGIITQTHSFQHVQTTPQAFVKASELIALGGRQQEVIKHIYKTKPLPLLKLWGRALARLKVMEQNSLAYSMLGTSDFEKAQSSPEDLMAVLKEMIDSIESYKTMAIIAELPGGGCRILAAVHSQLNGQDFLENLGSGKISEFNSGLYKVIDVTLELATLAEAENKFVEAVKNLLQTATPT